MVSNSVLNSLDTSTSNGLFSSSLPPEMRDIILGELDYRSLCRLGQTCVIGSEVVKANKLWSRLYQERWQDSSWANPLNWSRSFRDRFVAEDNWRSGKFEVQVSRNPTERCQGALFSALSNKNFLFVKSSTKTFMIPKNRFKESSYFQYEGNTICTKSETPYKKRRLNSGLEPKIECVGLSEQLSVIGWKNSNLEFRWRDSDLSSYRSLSSSPNVLGVSGYDVIAGCQNGLLAFASKGEVIREFRVNQCGIAQAGFISAVDGGARGVFFQNVFGELYYSDLATGFESVDSIGLGVEKCVSAADPSKLWLSSVQRGVYLADVERVASPILFTQEATSIRCLHAKENCLAVGTVGGKASLYDIRNTGVPLAVNQHNSMLTHVKTDGNKIFSGSFSGELMTGFADTTARSYTIAKPHDYAVTSIEVDPFMLFATFADGSIIKVDASFSLKRVSPWENCLF
ncbi:F-box protein [Estrella lausannensis]|uniref:F-box domain-containing protein n=1 Tax=Estrella lausannensis TaxID=483423 RepID=A0A0H5E7Q0_9BACT|nr:F-box protein [Estrella lausannensis]CRX39360.1 hypothetical protein ELAC_2039 [Estrella lausannensis]